MKLRRSASPVGGRGSHNREMVKNGSLLVLSFSFLVSLLGCNSAPPASPTIAPMLLRASPASAAVGAQVMLAGENFTATANHLKIGAGYLHNLSSPDGKTIPFTVPSTVDVCAPQQQVCALVLLVLSPGDYRVAVINDRGTSNEVTFTVIER